MIVAETRHDGCMDKIWNFCMGELSPFFIGFKSIIRKLTQFALTMGMGWVLVMMFLTTLDVAGRYFFSRPIPGAVEMSEFMLALFGVLGMAYTHGSGGNVKVTMLTRKLPLRIAAFLNVITGLLSLQIVVMIVWYGVIMAVEEFGNGTTTDTLAIPLYPLHILLSVGAFLLALEILINIIESIAGVIRSSLVIDGS